MGNLTQRLLTAAVGVPILLAIIYAAPWWGFPVLVIIAAGICGHEYYGIVGQGSRRMNWLGPILSMAIVAALTFFVQDRRVWLTVVTAVPLVALISLLLRPGDITQVPARVGVFALGLLYTGVLPALFAIVHGIGDIGPHCIVLLFAIAFLGDTGAYTAGRIFGRHKLYPLVSPKKTWEGAVGGLVSSSLAAVATHYILLPQLPLYYAIPLGLVLGAMGQIGDLCESLLKRAYDVKDSGKILPGHGGLLDRIDALLFVAAGFYLAYTWIPLFD